METDRTFSGAPELCCFPKGCLIPEVLQPLLTMDLIPRLEARGMKVEEWTCGALMLQEPHLSNVKEVVCQECGYEGCQFNPHFKEHADRFERGDRLLAQLLPEAKRIELLRKGIGVVTFHTRSRGDSHLVIRLTRGDKSRVVSCEVENRRLQTDEGEEILLSLEQMRKRIDEAIQALA